MNKQIHNMQDRIIKDLSNGLISNLENIFIEGLKRKGYSFNKTEELYAFIKLNCKSIDQTHFGQKVYLVYNIPFLIHKYSIDIDFKKTTQEGFTKISADYEMYRYV